MAESSAVLPWPVHHRPLSSLPVTDPSIQDSAQSSSPSMEGAATARTKTPEPRKGRSPLSTLLSVGFAGLSLIAFLELYGQFNGRSFFEPSWQESFLPVPLVMQGGDPHIRALMRTISASESHDKRPYSLIYGGERFRDFGRHPDRCVTIIAGPNEGDCSTAAGRYQFITTTWEQKAARYHPKPGGFWLWRSYSFSPEEQDVVVYRWLNDPNAWGVDLAALLRQGQLQEVLRLLSPTWTSLGYGIETNSMSGYLPEIYQEMLGEELRAAGLPPQQMAPQPSQPLAPHTENAIKQVQQQVKKQVTENPEIQQRVDQIRERKQEWVQTFDRAIEGKGTENE